MELQTFDTPTRQLAAGTDRRRALAGLSALVLGGVGALGLSRVASAQVTTENARQQCLDRCEDHCGPHLSNRKCRNRCQRTCENR